MHSCEFCIVNDYQNDNDEWKQKIIRFNKKNNSYGWYEQTEVYFLDWKIDEKKCR